MQKKYKYITTPTVQKNKNCQISMTLNVTPPSRNRVNKLPHLCLPKSYVLSLGGKDGKKLFYDEKKIAKLQEESIIVDKPLKAATSARIKKLRLRTAKSAAGLSEKRIPPITGKKL